MASRGKDGVTYANLVNIADMVTNYPLGALARGSIKIPYKKIFLPAQLY